MTLKVRDLRDFAAQVETCVRERCSSQGSGATASEPSYTQGCEGASVSPRATQGIGSIAVSCSTARPPTYMQVPEPPTVPPPSVPTSTTHFSTVQSDESKGY